MTAALGLRDGLIEMMGGEDSHRVPGCLSFIVAEDVVGEDVLWITEVWASRASHEASLASPPIKESVKDAETLIAGFEMIATTNSVPRSSHPLRGEASLAGEFRQQCIPEADGRGIPRHSG